MTEIKTQVVGVDNFKRPVKSILISQPKPEGKKSPYFDLADKYGIQVDFRPFIQVDEVPSKDFRKSKISIPDYSAIIFTSRSAIDHFFRICTEMRIKTDPDTKYYCVSESIALYLQKYILYRKRKVSFGKGRIASLMEVLLKNKDKERFLFPCSDIRKNDLPDFLAKNKFDYAEAVIYRTVASDLSDLEEIFYDMIVFFSPSGIHSLLHNFPGFEQDKTRIAAFGKTTKKAVADLDLRLDIEAPVMPHSPSMTMAIERYLKVVNGKK